MRLVEHEDDFALVSVPVNNGAVSLQNLRELVDATDALPETTAAIFLNDELRVEIQQALPPPSCRVCLDWKDGQGRCSCEVPS